MTYRGDVTLGWGVALSPCVAWYLGDSPVTVLKGVCGKSTCKAAGGVAPGGEGLVERSLG